MPVSSNTLFHFTNSAANLFNILQNEFIPHYVLETIFAKDEGQEAKVGIPMVSFCDIPLSQIKEHIGIYGNYGIGMSKKWGKANKLNPVLYVEHDSNLSMGIGDLLNKVSQMEKNEQVKSAGYLIMEMMKYLKAYTGNYRRDEIIKSDYRYYNEREWRYVPTGIGMIAPWAFHNEVAIEQQNLKLNSSKLSFNPDDISYVIIKKENEIDSMIDSLRQIKSKYNSRQVDRLISRILTVDQIYNDF